MILATALGVSTTSSLPLAVAGLAVLCLLVVALVRSQLTALLLLLTLFIPGYAIRDQVGLSIQVGSLHVVALDVVCGLLFLLGMFRALIGGHRSVPGTILTLLGSLLILDLARGVQLYGIQTATNQARPWFYFLSTAVYAATVPTPWDARAWRAIAAAGVVLIGIASVYLYIGGLHDTTQRVLVNGELVDSRPINAAGGLLILQATILLAALRWPTPRASVYLTGVGVVALVVAQQRTIWVAALICGLIGFVAWVDRNHVRARSEVFAATGILILALPVVAWFLAQSATLRVSAGETVQQHSTFQWRVQGWQELIANHHSATELAIGEPVGTSWARRIFGGDLTEVSAHSSYVEALLRFGIPGLLLFLALAYVLWRRRVEVARLSGLKSNAVALLLVTQMIYSVTYTLSAIQALIIGMFVSSLASARAAHPVARTEPARPQERPAALVRPTT